MPAAEMTNYFERCARSRPHLEKFSSASEEIRRRNRPGNQWQIVCDAIRCARINSSRLWKMRRLLQYVIATIMHGTFATLQYRRRHRRPGRVPTARTFCRQPKSDLEKFCIDRERSDAFARTIAKLVWRFLRLAPAFGTVFFPRILSQHVQVSAWLVVTTSMDLIRPCVLQAQH